MKNYLKLLTLFAFMLFSTTALFAQDLVGGILPDGDFTEFFTTFGALVAAIPVVTEFLKHLFKVNDNTPKFAIQLLSWGVGIILTMFGWWFQLGFLIGMEWYFALLYGFGASLAANGVADTKIIQWIFSLFVKK